MTAGTAWGASAASLEYRRGRSPSGHVDHLGSEALKSVRSLMAFGDPVLRMMSRSSRGLLIVILAGRRVTPAQPREAVGVNWR